MVVGAGCRGANEEAPRWGQQVTGHRHRVRVSEVRSRQGLGIILHQAW